MRAWTRLIFAGAAALALAAPGCTPGDGDDEADADVLVVPDAVADTAADALSDVPAGSRVYAGNMNFREGSMTCNVAFAITWDGEKFEDVQAYTAANPNAEHCDVEATTGVKVPIDQVTLRFGRYDDVDKLLKGGLELEFQSGGQTITSKLAWEGPLPSPATGFAGSVLEPFKNFTDISWHVGAQ